jgi:hypothetical protein
MAHLWTGGPLPARYLRYVACAHLYHCMPDEADRIPLVTIMEDLAIRNVEIQLGRISR